MHVTLTEEDLATLGDHGSVATITGTADDGTKVTFGVDHRMMGDIVNGILNDVEVEVELEGWEILARWGS